MKLPVICVVLLLSFVAACASGPADHEDYLPQSVDVAWLPEPGGGDGDDGGDRSPPRTLILPSSGRTLMASTAPGSAGASPSGGSEDEGAAAPAPKGDLAALAQNPIANSISVPFEQTLFFHSGEDDETTWVLNIQPVIPVSISDDWNLISRPIIPVMYVPGAVTGISSIPGEPEGFDDKFGLGDINYTGFFSPSAPGKIIWGAGPSISIPTATSDELGAGKWAAGPSVVALTIEKPIMAGLLLRHIWSFAGQESRGGVNQSVMQPFLNYNFDGGWYLMTAPIVVANWYQKGGNVWTVPLGGGVGKLLKFGDQPVNMNLQVYYNVARPDNASDWSLRLNIQFLFPK